jgi:hypothetical protein
MKNQIVSERSRRVPSAKHQLTCALQRVAIILAAVLGATSAQAHPGHDLLDYGAAHVATSLYHATIVVICGAVLAIAARFAGSARAQMAFRIATTACLVLAALLLLSR